MMLIISNNEVIIGKAEMSFIVLNISTRAD